MTSQTPAPVRFNPFSAEFRHDPYPVYRRLREARPVHRTMGMWVLTGHAEVRQVLRDRTFGAGLIPELIDRQARRLAQDDITTIQHLARKSLVFTDNPDHARLRGLVNRVFTAGAVAGLRPLVTEIAEELVGRAWADGGMDAIADLAAPLPSTVMSRWLDLPDELSVQVAQWTHDIRFLLEPGLMSHADFAHVCHVVQEFADRLGSLVAERRSKPGDDLVSSLLAAETVGGDRLSDAEIVFVCMMCFVAGNETTKSLIGNGLLALLRHPQQDALLRDDPGLIPGAVAEMLRYDSPLQQTKRVATRTVEVSGQLIEQGDQVLLCLGAANRDPALCDRPEEFDITRDAQSHLAFGHGMHGCLGGLLAVLQAEVVFERLYRHAESLRLDSDNWEWQDQSFIVRGLTRLPLTVR
ncbi:cytochrome P450 [Saccharopolyspora mangrovi]|uniref:Cytochrome P450 n=1 Tax=Saccharopolyspora mangrovi TaxID=3082379 RepID=A0ABU6AHE7_9PSEU|nr:cytochrome P450 [Saccharopolyspora sp. S2-29]MEB3370991.1 cytochrome P450 [Saccharopolyspora sp. S2-29]